MEHLALRLVTAPLLIAAASLAGRRWGHHVAGWLVAFPLTSGPVAFVLALDHGPTFAGTAAVGMMAGTISQVVFAVAYRRTARPGCTLALTTGCLGFAASTIMLASVHLPTIGTFVVTVAVVAAGVATRHSPRPRATDQADPGGRAVAPRWDLPARMTIATVLVLALTVIAPVIGPYTAGLLSPFPVFGAVATAATHHAHGPQAAIATLDGLLTGLAAPTAFFMILALTLPTLGLAAFALAAHAATMLIVPTGIGPGRSNRS